MGEVSGQGGDIREQWMNEQLIDPLDHGLRIWSKKSEIRRYVPETPSPQHQELSR